jgi:hypothetical protein
MSLHKLHGQNLAFLKLENFKPIIDIHFTIWFIALGNTLDATKGALPLAP